MPSLTDITWSRTTQTFETRGADGWTMKQAVITARTATIVDAPILPDHNTHVSVARTWRPTTIAIYTRTSTDPGEPGPDSYRVTISGHYIKKDGTPSKVEANRSWRRFKDFTGHGSMANILPWVAELVTELEQETSE